MHKSIFLLLMLLVLLTARTEMSRPDYSAGKMPEKAITIKATPEAAAHRAYDPNKNLSLRIPKAKRSPINRL